MSCWMWLGTPDEHAQSPLGPHDLHAAGVHHRDDLGEVIDLAGGAEFTCALVVAEPGESNVLCWQHGKKAIRLSVPDVVEIAGERTVCALDRDGAVTCIAELDQLHARPWAPFTVDIPPARELAIGPDHGCALVRDVGFACWGQDIDGSLGPGATRGEPPHRVPLTSAQP